MQYNFFSYLPRTGILAPNQENYEVIQIPEGQNIIEYTILNDSDTNDLYLRLHVDDDPVVVKAKEIFADNIAISKLYLSNPSSTPLPYRFVARINTH